MTENTRVGIDASNIRDGGGITHLSEVLRCAKPFESGVDSVVIWAPLGTLAAIDERPWLEKRHHPILERSFIARASWQRNQLERALREDRCHVLFSPGGTVGSKFRPVVTMSQNLLPFELTEALRYGPRLATVKQVLLRYVQSRSFQRASGTIFLTEYARQAVLRVTGPLKGRTALIPHGIDPSFSCDPITKSFKEPENASGLIHSIYVSKFEPYKHHMAVVEAIAQLRNAGYRICLDLIGPGAQPWLNRLKRKKEEVDPTGEYINLVGAIPYDELPARYANADLCIFASSCENMPNILVESMAAGLPIACSEMGPMPEILGPDGNYFNPQSPDSIAAIVRNLIEDFDLRASSARSAYARSLQYSWTRCAKETFDFLASFPPK